MKRLSLGLAIALALPVLTSLPASAAAPTVTSPKCGTLLFTNTSGAPVEFETDGGHLEAVDTGASATVEQLPAGDYAWQTWTTDGSRIISRGVAKVAACSSIWKKRTVDGDGNGDGKADVMGIQTGSGDLYYYRMTSTGLAPGVKAGTSWQSMVFVQQVTELDGLAGGNYLIAVRSDGAVFQYPNLGKGRVGSAQQIGEGLVGYSNFAILTPNNPMFMGYHQLVATKGDVVYGFDLYKGELDVDNPVELAVGWSNITKAVPMRNFDADGFADLLTVQTDGRMMARGITRDPMSPDYFTAPRQVGSGWSGMGLVVSTGSVDGDRYSDVIARRDDGNLYRYINRGGSWQPGVKIGANWMAIRILV